MSSVWSASYRIENAKYYSISFTRVMLNQGWQMATDFVILQNVSILVIFEYRDTVIITECHN